MNRQWLLEEAVELCRLLTNRFRSLGYLVALTGSVLTKGQSRKDLDLIIYPYSTAAQDLNAVRASLTEMGMVCLVPVENVHARWRKIGSADEKHVEVWMFGTRRIDLFFLEMTYVTGIRIKNFARFRGEHEVSPLEPKAYAIVARDAEDESRSNYLGKTTLPVALRYCLFGELPRAYDTLDDAISRGEDDMAVDVELSNGCFVSRERRRGKWTKLKLVIPQSDGSELELNQETAQRRIEELIGLDLANYDMCADIAQKTSDRFSVMRSGELTEVVNGWVGLDRLVEAEDLAAKGLGALSKELVGIDAQIAGLAWATEEEGRLRAEAMKQAQLEYGEAKRFAETRNAIVVSHQQWVRHAARAIEADTMREPLADLQASIAHAPDRLEEALLAAEKKLEPLRAQEAKLQAETRSLSKVAKGLFNGDCPVLPGFECPARKQINESTSASRAAHNEKLLAYEKKAEEVSRAAEVVTHIRIDMRTRDQLAQRAAQLEARIAGFRDSVDYIAQHGQPPEVAPEPITVDTSPATLAQRAYQEFLPARISLVEYESYRPKLAARIAVFRIAVLALEQAQRRLCEGVVQRIEHGANRRLESAGVDLRCEWRWGRETNKLATRCSSCGAEFPASAKVKQCQACQAVRGYRVEPKLHVKFSARSGGTEDLGGVAITLAAGEWVRRRRGSEWSCAVLDEPFASLDTAHRRALSGHLQRMVSDGVAQAFVIAHSRDVLESLPGRIEVVGRGEWSEVKVVA